MAKKRKKSRKVKIKPKPLSQAIFMIGLLGALLSIWFTYVGLEGKTLPSDWGMTLIIFFIIMVIASLRSLEIS